MGVFKDLTGMTFGNLTVVGEHIPRKEKILWDCKCSCGNSTIELTNRLTKGNRISCTSCSMKRRYRGVSKEKICGIYSIKNIITDQRYIGQSIDIARRIREHRRKKEVGYCHENQLHNDIEKYGIDNFIFETLEECDERDLLKKETYWINYYCSNKNGYNKTSEFSSTTLNKKLSDEDVKMIIEYLKSGNLSEMEIANIFNVSNKMISDINHGRCWKVEWIEYPVRNFYGKNNLCPICGKIVKYKTNICKQCVSKRFYESLPDRNVLKEAIRCGNFVKAGKIFNISDNGLRKWCKKLNLPTSTREIKALSDADWKLKI